jgi:predicted phage terminase large subunit-like protein
MALDPSKGRGDRSDYSAFVLLAVDAEGVMWIDADLARRDVRRIIDDGLHLARRFRPHVFGVEANQFQEVLAEIFRDRCRELNLSLPLECIHNHLSKQTRIRAGLTPHLARGEFRFLRDSPGTKLLIEQLIAFPTADFDDGPDALEMAVRLVKQWLTGGDTGVIEERVIA